MPEHCCRHRPASPPAPRHTPALRVILFTRGRFLSTLKPLNRHADTILGAPSPSECAFPAELLNNEASPVRFVRCRTRLHRPGHTSLRSGFGPGFQFCNLRCRLPRIRRGLRHQEPRVPGRLRLRNCQRAVRVSGWHRAPLLHQFRIQLHGRRSRVRPFPARRVQPGRQRRPGRIHGHVA